MRLILEIMSGPKTGQKIVAQAGQTVRIGRTSKAGVAIEDTFMSSQHFAIECVGGGCGLRDLGSRNGTKLNGKKVANAVLQNGDRIHAGQTEFVVHVEEEDSPPELTPNELKPTLAPSGNLPSKTKAVVRVPPARSDNEPAKRSGSREPERLPAPPQSAQAAQLPKASRPENAIADARKFNQTPQVPAGLEQAMLSYEAATPQGMLMRILQNQSESLMALIDATHDPGVLDLLRNSDEEYRSLYRDNQNLTVAPYLVSLRPHSRLLKQMTHEGWGRSWGVYLTCRVSLADLREYFRKALMVSTSDGVELFSRFYDPRFFRGFLESCTATEAERFFGPISSYFMESERPEILLQFTKTRNGADKNGHLLTLLE